MTTEPPPRLCFVAMPFSATSAATEQEWTSIFETLIRPAVEGAALGYQCRRSSATRGNLVRGIVEDLQAAHLVIADLTDRNTNVFYELGVRHALSDRTILLSQNRDHIPFDLKSYANHVYDWRTPDGRSEFSRRVRELLADVDTAPHRPDNPVSDFLGGQRAPSASTLEERLRSIEENLLVVLGKMESLQSGGKPNTDPDAATVELITSGSLLGDLAEVDLRRVASALKLPAMSGRLLGLSRRTLTDLTARLTEVVNSLNTQHGGQVAREDIRSQAAPFVAEAAPLLQSVEEFVLACIEADYHGGVEVALHTAGALLSLEETLGGGLKYAVGLPGYFALRLVLIAGAGAIHVENQVLVGQVLNGLIEVKLRGGQFAYQSIWRMRHIFFAEAFLGYADLTTIQLAETFEGSPHLARHFHDAKAFRESLTTFLLLVALRNAADPESRGDGIYPGYKLIDGAGEAVEKFTGRLGHRPDWLSAVARMFSEDGPTFRAAWTERARHLNAAELGRYWRAVTRLPDTLPGA